MVLFALCSSSRDFSDSYKTWTLSADLLSLFPGQYSHLQPSWTPTQYFLELGRLACPALPPWALLLELQMSLPPLAPWVLYIAIVSGTKPFLDLFHCIIWVLPAVLSCILEKMHRNHHTSPRSLFLSSHYIQFLLFSSYLSHCGFIFWSWL